GPSSVSAEIDGVRPREFGGTGRPARFAGRFKSPRTRRRLVCGPASPRNALGRGAHPCFTRREGRLRASRPLLRFFVGRIPGGKPDLRGEGVQNGTGKATHAIPLNGL